MQKAILAVTNPREVELTLTCAATVDVWEKVLARLNNRDHFDYQVGAVERAIQDAVRTVNKDFVGMASEDAADTDQ